MMQDEDALRWAVGRLQEVVERLEGMLDPWPMYCQRDPRWAGDWLGPDEGGGTLGGSGCAVTCAAMVATAVGCVVTPGALNRWLCELGGFSSVGCAEPRNQLRWEVMPAFCPLLEWKGRGSWRAGPADVTVIREAMERGPVVAEVDFDYRDMDVDQHFVVLLRWIGEDDLEIADPWDGARVGLVERYFNPRWSAPAGKVARVITGLRVLQAAMVVTDG